MGQEIIVYILLATAIVYLGLKFFFKKKKTKDCDNCP